MKRTHKFAIAHHIPALQNLNSREWVSTIQVIRKALEYRIKKCEKSPTYDNRMGLRSCYFNAQRCIRILTKARPNAKNSKVVEDLSDLIRRKRITYTRALRNHFN